MTLAVDRAVKPQHKQTKQKSHNFCYFWFQTLSFQTADANDSKVILANDPDADRLALAEKTG